MTPLAPPAGAAPPAAPLELPRFILSVDRVGGLGVWSNTIKTPIGDQTISGTSFAFLTATTSPASYPAQVYQTPRFAFDYMLGSKVTLGGSLGIFAGSSTQKSPTGVSQDGASLTMYEVAPRIGYFLPLNARWAFWPRVGITFFSFAAESKSTTGVSTTVTDSGTAADLEAVFVFRPTPTSGITAAAVGDVGLSGSEEVSGGTGAGGSVDGSASNFGIAFGAFVGF